MKYITVGDCCDILDSQRVPITASDRTKGIYPYYGANGVQDYVDDFLFDDELVLVAEDGGHFGSKDHPIAYRVSGKCWVNNHAHVLNPHEGIDVDYLCYSLMYYPVQSLIKGATRKKLNQADLRKMKIVLRPLDEQTRIVALIKEAEGESKICREIVAKLDTLVKSRFIEMFGDPVTNPMGWDKEPLKKHTDVIVGYPFSSTEYVANGIPIVGGYNLMQGFVQWENIKYLQSAKGYEQYLLKDNDIVIAMDRPWVGNGFKIAVIQETYLPAILIQRTACIRCCDVSSAFLYMLLDNVGFADHCHITGSLVPHISNKDILSYEIIVPPIALQNQFAAFVQQVDKSKSVLQKLLEKQELLRAALMQEYFG